MLFRLLFHFDFVSNSAKMLKWLALLCSGSWRVFLVLLRMQCGRFGLPLHMTCMIKSGAHFAWNWMRRKKVSHVWRKMILLSCQSPLWWMLFTLLQWWQIFFKWEIIMILLLDLFPKSGPSNLLYQTKKMFVWCDIFNMAPWPLSGFILKLWLGNLAVGQVMYISKSLRQL